MGDATSKLIRGLLEVFILEAVAREARHGYALIRELAEVFGDPPNRNQVYPLLNRLEKEGYLQGDRSEGRGKTRYRLTGKGVELLREYRSRTPVFQDRVRDLWIGHDVPPLTGSESDGEVDAGGRAVPGGPSTTALGAKASTSEAARPPGSLLAPVRVAGEPLRPGAGAAGGGSQGHAGGPCQAQVSMHRRLHQPTCSVEFTGLDPACATCQELLRTFRDIRDRWF